MREPEETAAESPPTCREDAAAGCREALERRVSNRATTNASCEPAPPDASREGQQDTYGTSRQADPSSAGSGQLVGVERFLWPRRYSSCGSCSRLHRANTLASAIRPGS